jgi:hypothetical protein
MPIDGGHSILKTIKPAKAPIPITNSEAENPIARLWPLDDPPVGLAEAEVEPAAVGP